MFGIRSRKTRLAAYDAELLRVLDRSQPIDALKSLAAALSTPDRNVTLKQSVISLDSSCFLRLAGHRDSADVVDFLNSRHTAPLILPGQTIQEFWNNRIKAVPTAAKKLKEEFQKIEEIIESLGDNSEKYKELFKNTLDNFSKEFEHLYDESIVVKTQRMLEVLQKRALVPFANRTTYETLAIQRNRTKTPPGFRDKDDNNGDFYVWIDLLRGLQQSRDEKYENFSQVFFVTEDKKEDWSRNGVAHPILSAELFAICGARLEIIDLSRLVELTKRAD